MNCPKCGNKMQIGDRICRRCHQLLEADKQISIVPPRAKLSRRRTTASRYQVWAMQIIPNPKLRRWLVVPLALIPGAAHVVLGQKMVGLLIATLLSVCMGVGMSVEPGLGQILIGIAASIHAYSIYDIFPAEGKQSGFARYALMITLLVGLMMYVYYPIGDELSLQFYGGRRPMVRQGQEDNDVASGIFWLVLLGTIIFIVSALLSKIVQRVMTRVAERRAAK